MTDNDIIKALECCTDTLSCPTDCPLFEDDRDCLLVLNKSILDLINRQKAEIQALREDIHNRKTRENKLRSKIKSFRAEIERLQSESIGKCELAISMRNDNNLDSNCNYCIDKSKAEAIKEFAERLKEIITMSPKSSILLDKWYIDNLVKEMVGDTK